MRLLKTKFILSILFIAVLTASCGGNRVGSAGPMASGGSIITIEASSYKFAPNDIRLERPGMLALEIKNVSGSEHNFTIKAPDGRVIKSIDIRPHSSIISNIDLPNPGTYEFYCNKTLHSTLGMKGKITVGSGK